MVNLTFHPKPVLLPSALHSSSTSTSSGSVGSDLKAGGYGEGTSLREHVLAHCPILTTGDFKASWWFPNGHLQTLFSAFYRSPLPHVAYTRTVLQVPFTQISATPKLAKEGTFASIALDFHDSKVQLAANAPLLVICHGLSGNSGEGYVRDVVDKVGDRMRCVVLISRGCGGTKLTTPQLYHGGWTLDLRCAVLYLKSLYPSAPVYGLGYSLGANIIIKYLETEDLRVNTQGSGMQAAMALSPPWDFLAGSQFLQSTFLQRIYSQQMGENLRHLILKNEQAFLDDDRINIRELRTRKMKFLGEFDELVTAPLGGFSSARDYYVNVSSHKSLPNIRTPLLTLSALDDPICPGNVVPTSPSLQSPYTIVGVTQHGGHLGWWKAWGVRWFGDVVKEWLDAMLLVPNHTFDGGREVELEKGEDGWTFEKGRRDIGFRVLEVGKKEEGDGGQEGMIGGL